MKILIVEDDLHVTGLLKEVLGMFGYEADSYTNASAALHAYQQDFYPLILLDIGLPGMDGLELCRRIRALSQGKYSVIVIITGVVSPEDLYLVLDAGADDYLTKPLDIPLLKIRLKIAERRAQHHLKRRQIEQTLQESQLHLQTVVSNVGVILWEIDKHGIFTFAEGKGLNILGLNSTEIVGKSIFGCLKEYPEILDCTRRTLSGEILTTIVTFNEEIFEIQSKPIQNEFGDVIGATGVSIAITERKQAEADSHKSRELLTLITDSVPALIAHIDAELRYLYVNKAYADWYGRSKEDIIGKYVCDMLDAESYQRAVNHYQTVLQGQPVSFENMVYDKQGKQRIVKVDLVPHFDTSKEVKSFFGLIRDITTHKRAEEELQKAKETAEDASNAKSEFLTRISHELRAPLDGILGYAQLLKYEQNLTEQQKKAIDIIHQSGEYLLTMMDDFLDLAKIEARKIEIEPVEFYLPKFLKNIVEIMRVRTRAKPIVFTYEFTPELPSTIYADEHRLCQILLNLLSNAIKFTKMGKVTFKVTCSEHVNAQSTRIRFEVEDTGIGILPEHLETIFLPFHQVGERRFHNKGSGLGLTISQQLVRMMGSELYVKSSIGQGSTFWFELNVPAVTGESGVFPETDTERTEIVEAASTQVILPPPIEDLALLRELAMVGDIRRLQTHVTRIETLDPGFKAFTTRIRQFAHEFLMDEIQQFIEHYLQEEVKM